MITIATFLRTHHSPTVLLFRLVFRTTNWERENKNDSVLNDFQNEHAAFSPMHKLPCINIFFQMTSIHQKETRLETLFHSIVLRVLCFVWLSFVWFIWNEWNRVHFDCNQFGFRVLVSQLTSTCGEWDMVECKFLRCFFFISFEKQSSSS